MTTFERIKRLNMLAYQLEVTSRGWCDDITAMHFRKEADRLTDQIVQQVRYDFEAAGRKIAEMA